MNKRRIIITVIVVLFIIAIALIGAIIAKAETKSLKGLAMVDVTHLEDLDSLEVLWRYSWGEYCGGADRCINMVRSMQLPQQCNDYLLVGNEPNAREPYGSTVSPSQAVKLVKAIKAMCPKTFLIVGNVSADNWGNGSGANWIRSFLTLYGKYKDGIGVHCYTQHLASYCIDKLKEYRSIYPGEMWVTEFSVMSGDPVEFKKVLDYASEKFTRYAAYTNRQLHNGSGWELSRNVELVNSDGSLTSIGNVYKNK